MLTPDHLATLRAMLDRLIPPDDFAGAWDAGVGDYVLRQLRGDLRDRAGDVAAGLEALDGEAVTRCGAPFARLTAPQQDELLTRVEIGDVAAAWPVAPQPFFLLMTDLAAEGYYSDPGNGGNRGGVAWAMIGYDPRPTGDLPAAAGPDDVGNIGKVLGGA